MLLVSAGKLNASVAISRFPEYGDNLFYIFSDVAASTKSKLQNRGLQSFWCNQAPGLAQKKIQLFVTDTIQLETNLAAAADIRQFEEFLR